METAGRSGDRATDSALARAEAAQVRLNTIRDTERAELELRDGAIVEAYELRSPVRVIARRLGISPTTVLGIIASH